jgi:hypothetical protein
MPTRRKALGVPKGVDENHEIQRYLRVWTGRRSEGSEGSVGVFRA